MPLEDVAVTLLTPSASRGSHARRLAQFEHTISRGRELLGSRTFWNVNSTAHGGGVAEMLRSLIGYARGVGHRRALGGRSSGDASSSASPSACTTGCTATPATAARWATPSAPPTSALRRATPSCSRERVGPGDVVLLHDPQTAGMIPRLRRDGRAGHLARARRPRPAQRPRARGVALPHRLRRARRRLRLLARGLRLGGARRGQDHRDRALDRRLLAEEPRDVVHRRDRGAARRRPGRRPPPPPAGDLRAPRRHRRPGRARGAARRGAGAAPRRPAARAGLALGPRSRTRSACWRRSPSTSTPTTSRTSCSRAPT